MRIAEWMLVGVGLFGIATADLASVRWALLQIALFSLPFALFRWSASENLRAAAFSLGTFLFLQALISPLVLERDFKTLPPNLQVVIDFKPGALAGMRGRQLITTDERGFRTTRKIDYADASSFRVFAIGASTTAQETNDDHETWTSLLERELQASRRTRIEVVNTGVSGVRAQHHLATLREIADLHPDAAIFLVGINDWDRHIVEHFSNLTPAQRALSTITSLRRRLGLGASLLGRSLRRLSAERQTGRRADSPFDFEGYYRGQRGSLGRPIRYEFEPSEVLPSYAATLEEIGATCTSRGIPCVFITQPTGYREGATEELKSSFWMTPPNQGYSLTFESMIHIAALYNAHLKAFARRADHPLCDAAEALDASPANFFDDCHFNTAGSRRMSEIVAGCLEGLVPEGRGPRGAQGENEPD